MWITNTTFTYFGLHRSIFNDIKIFKQLKKSPNVRARSYFRLMIINMFHSLYFQNSMLSPFENQHYWQNSNSLKSFKNTYTKHCVTQSTLWSNLQMAVASDPGPEPHRGLTPTFRVAGWAVTSSLQRSHDDLSMKEQSYGSKSCSLSKQK